jgi:uncharacterized protein DUF4397
MRFAQLALVMAAALAAAACDDDTATPASEARVRVVHASPDAPNVDVVVDGATVLSNVPFGAASDYLPVDAGNRQLQVRPAGSSTAVIDANQDLEDGSDYTVIASGLVANISALALRDDNAVPAAGQIRLRVVHGAPSAPAVDVYVTAPGADLNAATPTLSSVPFGAASNYLEVPAGNYQVRVTVAGTRTVAIDTGALSLAAGAVRTAIALDAPGGGPPFSVLLLADRN